MKSFFKKVLICLSQFIWGLPGSVITYYVADYIEKEKFFSEGHNILELIFILILWVASCGIFIPVWIFFMKKTGLSDSNEYKELQDAMKR